MLLELCVCVCVTCVCVYFQEFKLFPDKNHRKITNNRLLCLCNEERTINDHHIHIKLKLIHCFVCKLLVVSRFTDFGSFWISSIRLWPDAMDYYYSIGSIILFINKVQKKTNYYCWSFGSKWNRSATSVHSPFPFSNCNVIEVNMMPDAECRMPNMIESFDFRIR